MDDEIALKMAEAASKVLRDRTPSGGWCPSLVVVAEAVAAALHTKKQLEDNRDPMDELVAVSEEAGLYADPCPDCGGARYLLEPRAFKRVDPCPSCGGSGTRDTDADESVCWEADTGMHGDPPDALKGGAA